MLGYGFNFGDYIVIIEYNTDYYGNKWWETWFFDEHGNATAVISTRTKPTARQVRKFKKSNYWRY